MKKKKAVLWFTVLMIAATGCGNETEQLVESEEVMVEPINDGDVENEAEPEGEQDENDEKNNVSDGSDIDGENQEKMEAKETSSNDSLESDSLEGAVKEINEKDNFVIINKIFTEELNTGGEVGVISAGSEEEKLITVYFTEETRFKIKTVKNAGEETTEREGAFSDIKKESILNLKGKMDSKEEEFLAADVVIYEFIYS